MEILISIIIGIAIVFIMINFINRKKMDEFDDFSRKKEKEKFVKLKNMKLKKERVLAKVLIMKIGFLRKVCLNKMERHQM